MGTIMRAKQAGYNMLELVATIAVIGVLAGVAAPKFMNTNTAARISNITSAAEALESANRQIFAAATVKGINDLVSDCTAGGGTVVPTSANGTWVNLGGGSGTDLYVCTSYGFAADMANLAGTINLGDMEENPDILVDTIEHSKASDGTLCEVTYTPATSSTTPPVYTPDTADCS